MSVSPPTSTRSPQAEPRRSPVDRDRAGRRPIGSPWARLAVVGAILAASGGTRLWQEWRVETSMERGRTSPFPLAEVPMTLGTWRGRSTAMDPRIVRGSGSTDIITRRYVDQSTGVGLDVIVLYGPTSEMFIHTPDLCYPAAGYEPSSGTFDRPIVVDGVGPVPTRSMAFGKGEGGLLDLQEVYFSLRYDGRWTTRTTTPRASQRIPGMYRVQVSRRITARERRDVDNPIEPFLALLIGEIEARGKPSS